MSDDLEPTTPETPQAPWPDYDELNLTEIFDRLLDGTEEQFHAVQAYEATRPKPRKSILEAIWTEREPETEDEAEIKAADGTEDDLEEGDEDLPKGIRRDAPPGSPAATGDWVTPTV